MPRYPYECETCGVKKEVTKSIHEYKSSDTVLCPDCETPMFRLMTQYTVVFGRMVGRDTGIYDLDYGKRATEDLTFKAKVERLRKDGRFTDPFEDSPIPDYTPLSQEPEDVKQAFRG